MRGRDFSKIAKKLMPSFPGFAVKNGLMFRKPLNDILVGICFDASSYSKDAFYIWYFVLPLYVPTPFLHFAHGDRLRSGNVNIYDDQWNASTGDLILKLNLALTKQAMPQISEVHSPCDFIKKIRMWLAPDRTVVREAIAYSLIRIEEFKKAEIALSSLAEELEGSAYSSDPPIRARAQLLVSKLREDPAHAQDQLDRWEETTVKKLRMEKYWDGFDRTPALPT